MRSMKQPNAASTLVLAAAALDDELRALDELAQSAKAASLRTDKGLTRVTHTLTESVEQRARIEEKLRALVAEIDAARLRQEHSVTALVEVAHELGERSKEREGLLHRFSELQGSAASINELTHELSRRRAEGATDQEVLGKLDEIHTRMEGVAAAARELVERAETDGWSEIARHADAVRQQIQSAKSNLAAAQRKIAAGAPS